MATKRKAKTKPATTPKKMGRPKGSGSKYTHDLGRSLCEWVRRGHIIEQWLREHDIARETVGKWREAHPDFGEEYARAEVAGYEAIADRCREIAHTPMMGQTITVVEGDDGYEKRIVEADMTAHRKLLIDTEKWLLSKRSPRLFGDKVTHEHEGKVGLEHLILEAAKQIEEEDEE